MTPGKGKLQVTGQLGEVMQESAEAAMSYVRSPRQAARPLEQGDFYSKVDIHIHVPEGATPKDGPSAGHHDGDHGDLLGPHRASRCAANVAMTGEITLRGRVLPIGGLKEKLIAALRGGIDHGAHSGKENEKDLKDLPPIIKKSIKIHLVEHMDEVLRLALAVPDPENFLHDGIHDLDGIYEVPPVPQPTADIAHPAGVN